MKKIIHVNRHKINSNAKHKKTEPVLTVKTYKSTTYGMNVEIQGPSRIVYSPCNPLSCGAKVWIETTSEVLVDGMTI
jgi:hypothetical protein